eukprot:6277933-Prorocentrum_lima.AAC.1
MVSSGRFSNITNNLFRVDHTHMKLVQQFIVFAKTLSSARFANSCSLCGTHPGHSPLGQAEHE